jgi:FMN phosphatase YigB (HAD superfamily)
VLSAITFDFWNTICCEPPGGYLRARRLQAMSHVLGAAGVGDAGAELAAAYDSAWLSYVAAWEANRQFTGRDAVAHITEYLEDRFEIGPDVVSALGEAFHAVGSAQLLDINFVDGVVDVLDEIDRRGIPTAIVCDVGFTPGEALRRFLDQRGVLRYFRHWAFSDEVGVYKPDPRIFEHALSGLGDPEPSRCAHIGDRRRTDVAGAMAMGMKAVRLNAVYEDDPAQGPSGDIVIGAYQDLLPALGLQ